MLFGQHVRHCGPKPTWTAANVEDMITGFEGLRHRRAADAVAIRQRPHTDPFRQTVHESLQFEEIDQAGSVMGSEETSWSLRWSTRQETAYLLELTGFDVVDLYSDFGRSPPDYGREQLWVARAR